MANSPDTANITVGRGALRLARLGTDGFPDADGFRHCGNAPDFSLSVTEEDLRHQSSLDALALTDKRLVLNRETEISFTLEEVHFENLASFFSGTTSVESMASAAGTGIVASEVMQGRWYEIVDSNGDRVYDLGGRGVAPVYVITANAVTATAGDFTLTVNGETTAVIAFNAAAATILAALEALAAVVPGDVTVVDGGGGLASNNGTATITFTDDLDWVVTADFSGLTGNPHVLTNPIEYSAGMQYEFRSDTGGANTLLVVDVDFLVDEDLGLVFFIEGGGATEGVNAAFVTLFASDDNASMDELQALTDVSSSFALSFVAVNPETGEKTEWLLHKVSLSSDGDLALVGNDWQNIPFTGLAQVNNAITETGVSKVLRARRISS
jgi:hypothetical protein